ncbi:MAG: protein translocase subunit SecF [Gammaproteobacteria bacterium]|nr:protein translocase subunit SecF [Gammaproteobacteria bacterium]
MLLTTQFDFMEHRRLALTVSIVFMIVSALSLAVNSLQLGMDFTSGISIRLGYSESVDLDQVNATLDANGYGEASVVSYGSDRDIRIILPVTEETAAADQAQQAIVLGERLAEQLRASTESEVVLAGSDFVSAKAGQDLAEDAGLGILVSLGAVMVYISMRFQLKFAVGAVVALVHDVLITLGAFSIFRIQFDLTVLAAILAVIGYSLNDTIIVADRLRENLRRQRRGSVEELINLSINQTLSRTLITSGTTLLVVVVLLFVGSEASRGFCIAMSIGICVGTYSSIYIASALLLTFNLTREDIALPVKEDLGAV